MGYSKGVRANGEFFINSAMPVLPTPTYEYIGRFHGTAYNDGTGGYGNEMSPMSAIWDHNLGTPASASITGWAMTRSTTPAGIKFDYGATQNFPVDVKYGVNGFYSNGNLKIYADGLLQVSRDFNKVTTYQDEQHTLTVSNFRTLKFVLSGEIAGLGPHPNFKIYEIYPKDNLEGQTGTIAKKEHCDFDWGKTAEFAGASCADLESKGVSHTGMYLIKKQYHTLPIPKFHYDAKFYGYEIYHVWDKELSTDFSAMSHGGSEPNGITFDYGAKQNFPVTVRYGVNASPEGVLKVYVDGVLKETRPFPMVSDYPTHLHQDTYENFQTIKFELTGKDGVYPAPALKIFEIFPEHNLGGKTGTSIVNTLCTYVAEEATR